MGDATWLDYLKRFKFGVPTRFGLTDEYAGQLPADNIVSIAQSSFGQGNFSDTNTNASCLYSYC